MKKSEDKQKPYFSAELFEKKPTKPEFENSYQIPINQNINEGKEEDEEDDENENDEDPAIIFPEESVFLQLKNKIYYFSN